MCAAFVKVTVKILQPDESRLRPLFVEAAQYIGTSARMAFLKAIDQKNILLLNCCHQCAFSVVNSFGMISNCGFGALAGEGSCFSVLEGESRLLIHPVSLPSAQPPEASLAAWPTNTSY